MPEFRTCIFLFFSILNVSLPAQQKLTPEQWEEKLDGCYSLLLKDSPERGFQCLQKLQPSLEKSGYYAVITRYYTIVSEYYIIRGNAEKSLGLIAEGYKKHRKNLSDEQKIRFQLLELRVLENQGKNSKIISRIKEILPGTKSERNRAALYSIQASALVESGNYEMGTENYFKALRIFKSLNDTSNIVTVYNRLGLLNMKLEQPGKGLVYFRQALDYALQTNSYVDLQPVYENLASVYVELDSIGKGLGYYQKSMELARKSGNRTDLARSLFNMGNVYMNTGNYSRAFDHLEESMVISREEKVPLGIMYNFKSLGDAYTLAGAFEPAKISYDSALVYALKLELPRNEADIYDGLYNLYRKSGDYQKSLGFYIKSDSIRDVLFTRDKQKAIAELEILYETEIKDRQLEKIGHAFERKKSQITILSVSILSVVLIATMAVFFLAFRNRALRNLYKRNMELLNTVNYYKITPEATGESEQLKKVFDRLLELLNTDKIFKDPNLTVRDVAEMIGTNEKYVSSAISTYAKMNYNNFINFYRTNEAKELIGRLEFATLNEIMYACGFNSRTTFYNAFKNFTGLSPKQFKEMQKTTEPQENL